MFTVYSVPHSARKCLVFKRCFFSLEPELNLLANTRAQKSPKITEQFQIFNKVL